VTVVGHLALTSRFGALGAGLAIGAGTATALVLLAAVTIRHLANARRTT
jgi:hypothetical protein